MQPPIEAAKAWIAARADAALELKDYALALSAWKVLMALDSAAEAPPAAPAEAAGRIDAATAARWSGHLAGSATHREVQLRLGDRVIATTTASQPRRDQPAAPSTGFAFAVSRLWRYLGSGDTLAVTTADGQPVPIDGLGERLQVYASRRSLRKRLFRKLDAGAFFNKHGKLQRPLGQDNGLTSSVMGLFEQAAALVQRECDLRLFVFYGTLLGCVRNGNFIAHDDDIDVVYLSRRREPEAVKDEFKAVCQALVDGGYKVQVKPFGAKVQHHGDHYRRSFGMHYGWIDADGCLQVAFGYHGEACPVPQPIEFRRGRLGSYEVEVPAFSEAILAMLYGSGWRVPDPGFSHHTRTRKNDPRYHLSAQEIAAFQSISDEEPDDDED